MIAEEEVQKGKNSGPSGPLFLVPRLGYLSDQNGPKGPLLA